MNADFRLSVLCVVAFSAACFVVAFHWTVHATLDASLRFGFAEPFG